MRVLSQLWLDVEARQRTTGFAADAILEGTYLSETLNRRAHSAVAALRWRRAALTTFVLASEVRAVRFVRSPERDNDNLVATAGAEFHPRARLGLGPDRRPPLPGARDRSGGHLAGRRRGLSPAMGAGFEAGCIKGDSTTRARRRYHGAVVGFVLDYD